MLGTIINHMILLQDDIMSILLWPLPLWKVSNFYLLVMFTQVVVPRERPEGDHVSSSLNRRKRSAVSIADPMHITRHLQLSPPPGFDESSEFTQGLTPDEIYQLNQQRELPSPSERLRLFSFTKRHLRLPFRLRGKKERDKRGPPSDKEVTSPPTPKMKKATLSLPNVPDLKEGRAKSS